MTLGELIKFLETEDQEQIIPLGFNNPHSYRGSYNELAFEPAKNITVKEMLECAKEALGNSYFGYKGGKFKMEEYTDIYLAIYGCCGEQIGPILLQYMFNKIAN